MTRDDFRKHQKALCPPRRGGPGNRGIYGCGCCRKMNLVDFKQYTRRQAKVAFRRETEEVIDEQLELMGYWPQFIDWLDYEFWEGEEEDNFYRSLEDKVLEEIEVFFYEDGGHSTHYRRPLRVRLFELAGGLHV